MSDPVGGTDSLAGSFQFICRGQPREEGRIDPWESLSASSGFGLDLFGYVILVESQNVSPILVWFISLNIMTIRFVHIEIGRAHV